MRIKIYNKNIYLSGVLNMGKNNNTIKSFEQQLWKAADNIEKKY